MSGASVPLLDHLIRPLQERRRDRQAEGLGGLEVDDQLELGGLLDREVGGSGPLEDLVNVLGGATIQVQHISAIGYEASRIHIGSELVNRREPMLAREIGEDLPVPEVCPMRQDDQCADSIP